MKTTLLSCYQKFLEICEGFVQLSLSLHSVRKILEKNGAIMRGIFRVTTSHLRIGTLCTKAAPEGSGKEQDPALLPLWKGMRGSPD